MKKKITKALVGSPEVLLPTTDLRTFLMRLHRLSEDARNIEFPDPVAAMNCVTMVEILKSRILNGI